MTSIRNICTIAHVDHGKTTLVDHLLKQSGTFAAHETVEERVMDSDSLEREKGITISAKSASFFLGATKVNIVDTPGHADFGGEVERIMSLVDGAILLVDAVEGPLPQTRFVLEKAIHRGLKIILCINKVDRPEARKGNLIESCVDKVFDLFVELGASDEQCDFPIVYASARNGWCTTLRDEVEPLVEGEAKGTLKPLFDLILGLPEPRVEDGALGRLLICNVAYSEYVGSMALGKLLSGSIKKAQTLYRFGINQKGEPVTEKFQVLRLYGFKGLQQTEVDELKKGDIGLIAGCENITIGDTLGTTPDIPPLPRLEVEAPTVRMLFSINTSPFSGKEGKAIQSRELKDRLFYEVRNNPALRMEETEVADQYYLLGRGELQFAIIIERMRREGLEFMVGRPTVILKRDNGGKLQEPVERVTIDIPETYSGEVTKMLQTRKGILASYETSDSGSSENRVRLIFEIPTRGLLGIHSRFLTATRGTGLINSEFLEYREYQGLIPNRSNGSLVSDRSGKSTAYALSTLQQRGLLFIGEGVELYEGMVIGENAKEDDLNVNACRPKKLTNIRTTSSDGLIILNGIRQMSLEGCIEWLDEDEWIEITPKHIRLRKKVLASNMRSVKKAERLGSQE